LLKCAYGDSTEVPASGELSKEIVSHILICLQGVSSNFKNPAFLGWPVVIVAAVFLPLFLAFAAVRVYANVVVLKRWKIDDREHSMTIRVLFTDKL
jgi:membrane protein YdbS with pleckstrin-like domain